MTAKAAPHAKQPDVVSMPIINVVRDVMTDGSIAYNVEIRTNGKRVFLAANSRKHAMALCVQLNDCAWVDVA
jgi:hypothetical protein